MSAQPCGCDPEADWICKMHRDYLSSISPVIQSDRLDRFKARYAAEAQPTPAEQFRAEAVAVADAVEPQVCDCANNWNCAIHRPPMGGWHHPPMTPAQQRSHKEWLMLLDAKTVERDDLLNRIAILELEVAQLQRRNGQRQHDYLYLLEMERHDKEQFRDRIAAITATFYHADLTISSVQPILALACELNPDLVERAR